MFRVANINMPHMTPYEKQGDKEVSPTNSENSVSSGHSSRSSNQTSFTLLSEDSLFDNKNLGNPELNGKAFYYHGQNSQVRFLLIKDINSIIIIL